MVTLVCQNSGCSKEFQVWRHREHRARFCSLECANLAKKNTWTNSRAEAGNRISLTCKWCSKDFSVKPYRAGALYCSRACKDADKKREARLCFCGVSFVVFPSDKQKFCSPECSCAGRARSSVAELSLKPFLEPLGYTSTDDHPLYFTLRGRVRVPDYVNVKEHKIVEVFGEYWHRDRLLPEGMKHETPEETMEWFRELGWECQVVWVEELEAFKDSLSIERVS